MRILRFAALGAVVVASTACTAMLDFGRFSEAVTKSDAGGDDGGAGDLDADVSADKNLVLVLQRMAPHPTQLFELRIVDAANHVQTRGLIDPLGAQDVTIHVPSSVLAIGGPYRLDFYADMNGTRSYDGIGSAVTNDHAWRIPLVPSTTKGRSVVVSGSDMTVTFLHDTVFTDIDTSIDGTKGAPADTGLPAHIKFPSLPASYLGTMLETRIVNADTGHTVGLYRFPQMQAPPFEAVIPGVVEGEVSYQILVYIDANGNGDYENPATGGPDKGWCVQRSADPTAGLVYEFDPVLAGDGSCDVGAP